MSEGRRPARRRPALVEILPPRRNGRGESPLICWATVGPKWSIGIGAAVLCAGLLVLGTPDVEDRTRGQALAGDAEAQDNLGRMYAHGAGVPQDSTEAVKWFRLAAVQGHPGAQFNLGVSYADGLGVPQDDAAAMSWFSLAAGGGDAAAQARLGLFYMAGRGGVARDLVTAHMWFNLAASRLPDDRRDVAVKARDMVTPLMTPAQVREAQRRAREWADLQHTDRSNGTDLRGLLDRIDGVVRDAP